MEEATDPGVEKFNLVPCDDAPENAEIPGAVGGGVLVEEAELPSTGAGLNEKLEDDALEAALFAAVAANEKLGAPEPCPIFAKENAGTLPAAEVDEIAPLVGFAEPRTLGAPNAGFPTEALADDAALGEKEIFETTLSPSSWLGLINQPYVCGT